MWWHGHIRGEQTTDPLHVLRTTAELIESLRGDTFDTITTARYLGATWEQMGEAVRQRPTRSDASTPPWSTTWSLAGPGSSTATTAGPPSCSAGLSCEWGASYKGMHAGHP